MEHSRTKDVIVSYVYANNTEICCGMHFSSTFEITFKAFHSKRGERVSIEIICFVAVNITVKILAEHRQCDLVGIRLFFTHRSHLCIAEQIIFDTTFGECTSLLTTENFNK